MQLLKFASEWWKLENNNHSQPRPAAYVGGGLQRETHTFGSNAKKHDKAVSSVSGLQKVLTKEQVQAAFVVWFLTGLLLNWPCGWMDGWMEKKS